MRRYIILLIVLLAALFWFEPFLRSMLEAQALRFNWIPTFPAEAWTALWVLTLLAVVVIAVVVVVRIGIYIWREVLD
jgi:hypothetical protein